MFLFLSHGAIIQGLMEGRGFHLLISISDCPSRTDDNVVSPQVCRPKLLLSRRKVIYGQSAGTLVLCNVDQAGVYM